MVKITEYEIIDTRKRLHSEASNTSKKSSFQESQKKPKNSNKNEKTVSDSPLMVYVPAIEREEECITNPPTLASTIQRLKQRVKESKEIDKTALEIGTVQLLMEQYSLLH